ncbi:MULTISPECIES: hypothetical protein [unclassified Acidithiobacillus]|nr:MULTISPECIES: hypothetical protein [unclassified Acidithiobacillus]
MNNKQSKNAATTRLETKLLQIDGLSVDHPLRQEEQGKHNG